MSKLRVNDVIPANGLNIGIGTAGGNFIVGGASTTVVVNGTFNSTGNSTFDGKIGIGTAIPSKQITVGAAITTSEFQVSPHAAGWDIGVTSGNISPHYQTNVIFYNGQIGSGSERLRLSSEGYVTTPNQPSFFSRPPASYNLSAGANTIGGTWSDVHNIGSHFSNGTFTAPVAGTYHFDWSCFVQSEADRIDAFILVNGTTVMREEITGYPSSPVYNKSASVHGSYYLSASDTVTFGLHTAAGTNLYTAASPWQYASGFLVG